MKQTVLRPWTMAVCMLILGGGYAQVTTPNNQPSAPTDFVGWDNTVLNDPLRIRHNANQPIEFYTHALQRMRLYPTGNITVNGYAGNLQNGFVGISNQPLFFTNTQGPFTRLHLADSSGNSASSYAQQRGYRPWQRNGITFTGNADHGYIGQKFHFNEAGGLINDRTDMVMQWSNDLDGVFGPDILTFRFTTSPQVGANTGARSYEGLEGMRLFPESHHSILVGIGDYHAESVAQGVDVQPEERLDVVDRTIRIRRLVPDYQNDSLDMMVVTDSTGRLHWRPLAGITDCGSGWTLNGDDAVTAFDGNPCIPQSIDKVGIGTDVPQAKLHVFKNQGNGFSDERAGFFHTETQAGLNIGMEGLADGLSPHNVGGKGVARESGRAYGLWGLAESGGQNAENVGVFAEALYGTMNKGVSAFAIGGDVATAVVGSAFSGTTLNRGGECGATGGVTANGVRGAAVNGTLFSIGVEGEGAGGVRVIGVRGVASGGSSYNYGVYGTASGTNNYAGWFDGRVWITGQAWVQSGIPVTSDGDLKTNVESFTGGLEKVLQLSPKTYLFDHSVHPHLELPAEQQIGLIAQEVEQVVPEAVATAIYPSRADSLGNVIQDEFTIKGIDYMKLIPVLIGAVQEQQAQIASQYERLEQLEQALAACCAPAHDGAFMQAPLDSEGEPKMDPAMERLLRIDPNPFTEATTVRYTLERAGRVQLLVNSGDGKRLQVLHDGLASAGDHSYDWNTGHLAPGVYYVTLLLDGEPLVKRAVKVR